jgi:uncharacterized protein YkwD
MLRGALTIALAVAIVAIGPRAPAAAAIGTERGAQSASGQSDLIALINAYRASNGRQQVSPRGALTAAAAWMAGDMAARSYMGHVSSDGHSPTQRMSAFGYPVTSNHTGENLAAGYENARAVLAAWQASAAHHAVLLNPNYDAVGIGLVYNGSSRYKWYWAADFGGAGGTVKVVLPPQPVAARADPAPRGSPPEAAEETVDRGSLAQDAWVVFVDAKRIAHLLAVLQRMGEI